MPGPKLDGGVLTVSDPDRTYCVYAYSAEQGPALEALVSAAVEAGGAGDEQPPKKESTSQADSENIALTGRYLNRLVAHLAGATPAEKGSRGRRP